MATAVGLTINVNPVSLEDMRRGFHSDDSNMTVTTEAGTQKCFVFNIDAELVFAKPGEYRAQGWMLETGHAVELVVDAVSADVSNSSRLEYLAAHVPAN